MNKMDVNEKASEITDKIYNTYGSGSGCLFGLASSQRNITQAIVKATLMLQGK